MEELGREGKAETPSAPFQTEERIAHTHRIPSRMDQHSPGEVTNYLMTLFTKRLSFKLRSL